MLFIHFCRNGLFRSFAFNPHLREARRDLLHPLSLPTSKVLFVSAHLDKEKDNKIQAEVWPYSDMASLNSEKRCNMPGEKQPVMDHHARRPLALSCQREVFVCMESQRDTLLWHV